ncbi:MULTISPECIES: hypothetical protein [Rhizobium]|uniref:Uncharacterized protein n=1 Tax=Rhizobium laguerreae TaxID=1076926 RepID=A0AAX2QI10_9HYPH|nr:MULTISPECIES: hypothetical protein [Rhizobium]MBY3185492.1 hypothetical protein [Rhizobium laguerreae]MBY3258624.1 hypothetical protein [Rhizobium laguerreae]MBY3286461.1 hypothetical protein [Rhizobium laguerreae]MBY3293124.1 hypothetical protein [Rhizobium laguerreae]MBY3300013.1 hypothetical protein [Rhizobium laguerreae]
MLKLTASVFAIGLTTLSALGMSEVFTARAEEPKRCGTAIIHMPTEQRVFNLALRATIAVYAISGKIVEPLIDRTYDGYVGVRDGLEFVAQWAENKRN